MVANKRWIPVVALSALLMILVGVLIWQLLPSPQKNAHNISIAILGIENEIYIEGRNYSSNLVVDILRANNEKLQIPTGQLDSGFITNIAGVSAEWIQGYWWLFEINGVAQMAGILERRVSDGDKISFRRVSSSYNPWEGGN